MEAIGYNRIEIISRDRFMSIFLPLRMQSNAIDRYYLLLIER